MKRTVSAMLLSLVLLPQGSADDGVGGGTPSLCRDVGGNETHISACLGVAVWCEGVETLDPVCQVATGDFETCTLQGQPCPFARVWYEGDTIPICIPSVFGNDCVAFRATSISVEPAWVTGYKYMLCPFGGC